MNRGAKPVATPIAAYSRKNADVEAATVAAAAPAALSNPAVSEYRPKARLRAVAGTASASIVCSMEANGPRSTLAAPSIPVRPATTSSPGDVARARSSPVRAISAPLSASVRRRPMRWAIHADARPESEAAARPRPSVSPISPPDSP